jgi:hypothetical protein
LQFAGKFWHAVLEVIIVNTGGNVSKKVYKAGVLATFCAIAAIMSAPASAGRPAGKAAYTWGKISVGSSTTSVQLTGVSAISRITLTSTLLSGDINENGEGENLVWSCGAHDDGGKLTQYWVPIQQSFLASSDNPYLNAGIYGADGDESAVIVVDVDPAPPPQWIPDDIKDMAQKNASNAQNNASSLGTAGRVCKALTKAGELQFKGLCEFISASQKTEEGWGHLLNAIANDPSDSNYTEIATPVTPVITPVPPTDVPQSIVDAYNVLMNNQLQSIGVMRAIITSTNRATGAYNANDDTWMAKQAAAGAKYRAQLGNLMQQKTTLLTNLQNALRANNVPSISVSASDILGYEINLLSYGFAYDEQALYTQLGYSADDIELARKRLAARDVSASAGTYPDMFMAAAYTADLQKLANALQFVPLTEGQEIKANGVFNTGTGGSITYKLRVTVQNGQLVGEVEEQDHTSSRSFGFQSTSLTSAAVGNNKAIVDGSYLGNDNSTGTFHLQLTNGDGGSSKGMIKITLSTGQVLEGLLDGGNIKIPQLN